MQRVARVFRRAHSTDKNKTEHSAELTDFIELWTPDTFKKVGVCLALGSVTAGALVSPLLGGAAAAATAFYWVVGLRDMRQTSHTITRNSPVLGHMRLILESVRPCVCKKAPSRSLPRTNERDELFSRAHGGLFILCSQFSYPWYPFHATVDPNFLM